MAGKVTFGCMIIWKQIYVFFSAFRPHVVDLLFIVIFYGKIRKPLKWKMKMKNEMKKRNEKKKKKRKISNYQKQMYGNSSLYSQYF